MKNITKHHVVQFATISDNFFKSEILEQILEYGEVVNFDDRVVILEQGQPGTGLYVILTGEVEVSIKLLGSGYIKIANLAVGNFFGEVTALQHSPCTATVKAIGPTSCFILHKEGFDALYWVAPEMHYGLLRIIIEDFLKRQEKAIEKIKQLFQKKLRRLYDSSPKTAYKIPIEIKKQSYLTHLFHLPIFKNLTLNEFETLLIHSEFYESKGNLQLICKNQKNSSLFFILKGAVQVGIADINTYSKIAVYGPHTLFSATTFIDNLPPKFSYTTCGHAIFLEITDERLNKIMQTNLPLWYKLNHKVCRHIVSFQFKLNTQLIRLNSETYFT